LALTHRWWYTTLTTADSEIKQRFVQLIDPSTSDSLNGFGTKESQDDALYMEYFRTNRICQSGDVILSSVLQSLEDSRANVKRKALSVLSSLADDHASLIIKSSMLWRLHKLIRDGQAVVKDATLELLSKFLTISVDDEDMASTLRRSVQNAVCTCMSDKSLSVRKRAVKLAPAIARDLENLEMSGGVMYSLLLRDQDDDVGVQDLSRQMLTTILFKRSPSREFVLRVAKVLAAIQSKLSKELINQRDDQLRMYLLRTLNSKGQIPVRESAREIVKVAVEDNLLEPFDEVTDDLLSLLDLVALISQSDGKLVSQDEVIGLADVFMKPDASDKLTKYARHQTFVILQSGLSSHISMSQQFLKNLHATLQKLLTKLSPHDLAEMIPCFWMTAVETDNTVSIARTLVAVLKGLKTETNPQKLVRLIGIAGNIARYCDLENHAKYFMGMDTEVNASSVVDLVIRSVFRFTKEPGTPLSNAAVTIMGAICNSHPKHFANPVVKNSFQRVMCVKGDFAMEDKIKIMESINNYVILESDIANAALVHKTTKSNHLETHVLHGSGTSRPDDAAVKTLLELIFKQVVDLSLDSEGKLAEVAALLLARSLEQGLLSPLKLIHTIICLELSSNDYISRIAIDVHKKLHQTRESKIESFYVDGLQAAADYKRNMRIRQLRGQPLIEGISDKNPLKPLYDIVSQMTKGQRRLFFVKLCRSFTFEPDHATPEELLRHLNYTLFLVRAISLLHLSLADEVLMVLYGIDSLYHASSPVIVHGVEQAGDAVNWQRYGVSSAILLLFWELRRYLREAYKITDEMCIEFSPRSCQMKVEARKSRNQVLNLPFGDYLTTSLAERPIEWYQEMGRNFTNLTLNEDVSTTHAGDSELDESRLADDDGQDEGDEEGESSQRASKRRRN
jgi:cohesin loading factor subunit SCC2